MMESLRSAIYESAEYLIQNSTLDVLCSTFIASYLGDYVIDIGR